jgi:hypothetical protein
VVPARPSLGRRTRSLTLLLGAVLALGAVPAAAADEPVAPATTYDDYQPGREWRDTDGDLIQAHGGQVVAATDDAGEPIWYWYGEDRTHGTTNTPGVHVYSSTDLYSWTDEGLALQTMTSRDQFTADPYFAELYGDYTDAERDVVWRDLSTTTPADVAKPILERPKVIHNEANDTWVMWVHTDGPSSPDSTSSYGRAWSGVAVADSPTGPFRWIDSYRLNGVPSDSVPWCGTSAAYDPAGGMARDMNLFVDTDGTAYIIYSSEENRTMYISKLDADYTYLSAAPEDAVQGEDFVRILPCSQREAPAMFHANGQYYLITSGATGWSPNPARYATADSVLGTWTDRGNPATGDGAATTFGSQSTSVIPLDPENNRFIYMGDRWTPGASGSTDLGRSPYIWLPLTFGEGGSLQLNNATTWRHEDLAPQSSWQVDVDLDWSWVGDDLPATVDVTSDGVTESQPVTWEFTEGTVGTVPVTGTLADGRTFTREVLRVPHDLVYVADSGAATVGTGDAARIREIAAAAGTPVRNDVPDQPLTAGATWGWTSAGAGVKSDVGDDLYETVRYAANNRDITYTFRDLEPGEYEVHAGFWDPWAHTRTTELLVNGEVRGTLDITDARSSVSYPATVAEGGELTFTSRRTTGESTMISFVMVSRVGAEPEPEPQPQPGREVDVVVSARAQCWGDGRAVVAVHTANRDGHPVDVRATTPFGEKKWTGVADGTAVYQGFESGVSSIAAGTVSVAAYAYYDGAGHHQVRSVPYSAVNC